MLKIAAWVAVIVAIATSGASAHPHTCPPVHAGGAILSVTVVRGNVGCPAVRRVLHAFMSGGGVQHGGPYEYEKWWDLGRWRCAHGAGAGSCIRGGSNYQTATDYIIAQWVAWECGHQPAGTSCRK